MVHPVWCSESVHIPASTPSTPGAIAGEAAPQTDET